jgi:tetratricopeptide (TPR) repeat protein
MTTTPVGTPVPDHVPDHVSDPEAEANADRVDTPGAAPGADPVAQFVEEAQADPASYRRRADDLLARHHDDPRALVHVRWGLGLALRELGELPRARRELADAAREASGAGETRIAALIRSSRAVVLFHLGDTEQALAETSAAADALDGVDAARNEMQRGVLLQRLGHQDDAVAAYDRALPRLRDAGDLAAEARLLSNRGVLLAYRGKLTAAQADLERSVELARSLGGTRGIALGLQNLGFVAGRQGRLPEALALLEEADGQLRELDDHAPALAVLDADRAEVLADAGLLDEAIERAEAAARGLSEDRPNHAEALLLVARLRLLAGHHQRAAALADQVAAWFHVDGRHGWELQARYVALAARAGDTRASDTRTGDALDDVAAAAHLADDLEAGGWATEGRAARLLVARQALASGRTADAQRALEGVRGITRHAPALARAQHWYATALLRAVTGDRGGSRRALAAGLDLLDRSRLVFGSAELRAHAAAHTTDLVELAIRLALEDDRPAEALRALDRVRATDVAVAARPPEDAQLAGDLAELRRLDEVERGQRRDGQDTTRVTAARAEVERRIRDRARALAHRGGGDAEDLRLDLAELRRALAGRTLAAYFQRDGELHVLAVTPGATRHHRLGPTQDVRSSIAYLRAAVRRLAYARGSAAALATADSSLARSTDDLTRMLGLDHLDPDGLVVVPTAALDGMPWAALAAHGGHVPTVAPSARAWLAAATHPRPGGRTLLVAGPDVPGATAEVRELARQRPDATVLAGPDATTGAVLGALEGSATAHLGAHGTFRVDNPLFSSLRLADGPLTVYELEGLRRLPHRLVLSSCEAAASTTLPGDAVLGLSSVLLRLGVCSLIAPVVEVPDAATRPLMVDLHRRLATGAAPERALADAVAATPDDDPAGRAARSAFVVLGASPG